ncbi:hypothetical protein GCM10009557_07370 [Virgisporangium ochraceum]|uniref:Uncharacterized protein n=1 Tax=Virgisporangium ochraceum TaxID=65505 RepID=A0A8J4EHA0_9ACTN|nr:hypothetical protein [Virgisporangium ochraceum]GIJ74516.1 hypothetical protein Voc01_094330 [Virgisporangium ochraceum]
MTYPTYNPLSAQATFTLEGSDLAARSVPTLVRPAVRRMLQVCRRFVTGLPDEMASGRAAALFGEHGSGKTHTFWYVLNELAELRRADMPWPLVVYVRADGPDPLELYRRFTSKLNMADFLDACNRAFISVAGEILSSRGEEPDQQPDASVLETTGSLSVLLEYFDRYQIEETAVRQRQIEELDSLGNRQTDFQRIITGLSRRDLAEAAFRWLTAGTLFPRDLERLGVSAPLQTRSQIRTGLQLIAVMLRRAGTPLLLVLDQAEAFLTGPDGKLDKQNAGTLRSVAEAVPRERGMFVMGCAAEAWHALPADIHQRFGPAVFESEALSDRGARDLLAVYLAPWAGEHDHGGTIHPFTDEAVRWVLQSSGGNVRHFLQTCAYLFDQACPRQELITGEMAHDLHLPGEVAEYTRESVAADVEEVLRASSVPYELTSVVQEKPVEFRLLGPDRKPTVFIQVMDAVFGSDDVAAALTSVRLVKESRRLAPSAKAVLVVCGYVSSGAERLLADAVDELLVARDESFADRMRAVVSQVTSPAGETGRSIDAETVERIEATLAALQEARRDDATLIRDQLATFTREMDRRQAATQLEGLRTAWAVERQRIEHERRQARADRAQRDFDQLEKLTAAAEREWNARMVRLPAIAAGVLFSLTLLVAGCSGVTLSLVRSAASLPAVYAVAVLVFMTLAALLIAGNGTRWGRGLARRELAGPAQSLDDLDRLAWRYVQSGRASRRDLADRNPHLRYAALAADQGEVPAPDLLRAMLAERSAVLRRHIAARLARTDGGMVTLMDWAGDRLAQGNSQAGRHELSVAIEVSTRDGQQWLPEWHRRLRLPLTTLAILCGQPIDPENFLDSFLVEVDSPHLSRRVDGLLPGLARAFVTDDDSELLAVVEEVPERLVRQAADQTSPVGDGLGTYDWLQQRDRIDELHLFFSKVLLYMNFGASLRYGSRSDEEFSVQARSLTGLHRPANRMAAD